MTFRRHLVLPSRGRALVSTDLHGNADDFRKLRATFLTMRAEDPETHWIQLGDVVHAPDERARAENPALYDFPDESWAIVDGLRALMADDPSHVHFVLGNHDYGHIGGMRTDKFHPDEVAHLESTLDDAQRAALKDLFRGALLAVVAPCGALMCHGSPDDRLGALADLDRIELPPAKDDQIGPVILRSWLTAYGQPPHVTSRLLAKISRDADAPITFVVHGHDRDESGFYVEGENQICPVIFGAPRANKRCLVLDLSARYGNVRELRDGAEIVRIHGA
jgi:hypothetical protein